MEPAARPCLRMADCRLKLPVSHRQYVICGVNTESPAHMISLSARPPPPGCVPCAGPRGTCSAGPRPVGSRAAAPTAMARSSRRAPGWRRPSTRSSSSTPEWWRRLNPEPCRISRTGRWRTTARGNLSAIWKSSGIFIFDLGLADFLGRVGAMRASSYRSPSKYSYAHQCAICNSAVTVLCCGCDVAVLWLCCGCAVAVLFPCSPVRHLRRCGHCFVRSASSVINILRDGRWGRVSATRVRALRC